MLVTLNEVLAKAKEKQYAVGLFNTINMEMLQAAIETAEENKSPIIIGTAEVLLPYGELDLIAPSIIAMAKKASVPVVVHYDHGLTEERCKQAMALGFSSIMYDCSTLSESDNIDATREMVKLAHSNGVSVEGEIGHIGGTEGQSEASEAENAHTTVDEAVRFATATGVDALAVAVGSAHGLYKFKPKLNFDRISEIKNNITAPLVLHGGSGLSDDDFINSIKCGISKVNIFTDLCVANIEAAKAGLLAQEDYLTLRNRQVEALKEVIKRKMTLFSSINKA